MKRYTDIVFDIDGTLIDTERTGVLSLIQTVKELTGKEMSYEEAYGYFGTPSARASRELGCSDAAHFAEVWEEHFQELMYLVKPFPGVEQLLADVKKAGLRTGIVTSRSHFEFSYDPTLKRWGAFFDKVVCSEDSERHKPFPDPMLAYMKAVGAKPETTLFVGDTVHDWQCGHAAGCDFALADWSGKGDQGIAAEYRFTDVSGLRRILGL